MVRIPGLLILLCFAAAVRVAPGQPPTPSAVDALHNVLERGGAYVRDFQIRLAGIVAEERYVQQVKYLTPPTAIAALRANAPPDARRVLRSDLLLVKPEGATRWVQFRDVFEVDGKPVHDRSERLVKLFLEPTASSAQQVTQIVNESSRFNIGSVQRTINVPVLALIILDPANQRRFSFERGTSHKPQLGSEPKAAAGADVWVIEYDEVSAGTLIRTNNDRDLPIHGRLWIEPSSGRVFATELSANDTSLKGTIDVTYRIEPTLNLLVPSEMHERYELRKDGSRVEGTATYTQFRQFQVKVDEKLAPIK
jgi:hypothetical protein